MAVGVEIHTWSQDALKVSTVVWLVLSSKAVPLQVLEVRRMGPFLAKVYEVETELVSHPRLDRVRSEFGKIFPSYLLDGPYHMNTKVRLCSVSILTRCIVNWAMTLSL